MLGWTVLKAWMAACWKVSWNVDPLALSVPVSLLPPDEELLAEELPLAEGLPLPDELQAARAKLAATSATPAVVTPWMRTRCIFRYPSLVTRRASPQGLP